MSGLDSTLFFDVQQKTDKQHILDNPDTYIGSIENVDYECYVLENDKITSKTIVLNPGLYKLFDEGIVNCRDHTVRCKQMISENKPNIIPVSYIDISINTEGIITLTNDGNGIDIAEHPEYNA